jgi:predicted anti-sigma-YlaC factor YlaD
MSCVACRAVLSQAAESDANGLTANGRQRTTHPQTRAEAEERPARTQRLRRTWAMGLFVSTRFSKNMTDFSENLNEIRCEKR